MNPEDSHVYVYDFLGNGKFELTAEYTGFPLQPIGNIVIHDPPMQCTWQFIYSHLGRKNED